MESWFLIVTIASRFGMVNVGFGGVSITETHSLQQCEALASVTLEQLHRLHHLDIEKDEVILTCKKVDK